MANDPDDKREYVIESFRPTTVEPLIKSERPVGRPSPDVKPIDVGGGPIINAPKQPDKDKK